VPSFNPFKSKMPPITKDLVLENGDGSLQDLPSGEYKDAEIIEAVALFSLKVFENYLNLVVRTDIEHRKVSAK
jgi:hypothetical protein